MVKCSVCNREYSYDRKKGHTKTKCNSCMANNRRFALKQRCVDYKGGSCVKCGYDKCNRALHFHHIDDTTKSFGIGENHCRRWSIIKEELDKCELICANCHAEIHYRLFT